MTFWAILKHHILCKTVLATLWATFGDFRVTFYFKILSHSIKLIHDNDTSMIFETRKSEDQDTG